MAHKRTYTDLITVIGININTSFTDGQDGSDIKNLWERWFSEQVSKKIPNTTSSDIYNIYHNYQDKDKGDYSVLLGHRVSSLEDIPTGLVGLSFQPGSQIEYEVQGPLPDAVIETWNNIRTSTDYQRAFIADYDTYSFLNNSDQAPIVKTYVSIRE